MIQTISTLALALAAAALPTTAAALGNSSLKQAQERYRTERATCMNGQSHQSLQTCLREAEAAPTRRRSGLTWTTAPSTMCATRTDAATACRRSCIRPACTARMAGAGTVSGSVAAGGIYRELVTVDPVKADKPPTSR